MFDMGPAEIAVIVIVAILVFGPDKLPDLAKQAGRFIRTARTMVNNARADLSTEMGSEFDELKKLRELDPREMVRRNVIDSMELGDDENGDGKDGKGDQESVDEDSTDERTKQEPLAIGERPPYDPEAT